MDKNLPRLFETSTSADKNECYCLDMKVGINKLLEPLATTLVRIYQPLRPRKLENEAILEELENAAGAVNVGWGTANNTRFAGKKIGVMVAGNSGKPGGSVGTLDGEIRKRAVRADYETQEEDIVSDWLYTASADHSVRNAVYGATIGQKWGMLDVRKGSTNTKTIQGVNYVDAKNPNYHIYGEAWTVNDVLLSMKKFDGAGVPYYDRSRTYQASLVFVSGPNAGCERGRTSSTGRTLNKHAAENYDYFRIGVKDAVRAGLDAMAAIGCDVALVARISCGIYAGDHKARINAEYNKLVNEVLDEQVYSSFTRRQYFDRIAIPMLPSAAGATKGRMTRTMKASPKCPHDLTICPVV